MRQCAHQHRTYGRVSSAVVAARHAILALAGAGIAATASAGLGGDYVSLARDREVLHAGPERVVSTVAFDRHEFTTASGARVREYVSRNGAIFAVTWSGPTCPDLRTVLGEQYAEFVAAAKINRHNHHLLTISAPELAMVSRRLQRGFAGRAYLPALMPAGLAPTELE